MSKVYALALGTGYAETASYSHLIVVHPKGFKTVQDALCDLRTVLINMIRQENKEYGTSIEQTETVSDTLYSIIRGDYQVHGDFWESMANGGWYVGSAWVHDQLAKRTICFIDRAPELIESANNWRYSKSENKVLGRVDNGDEYLINIADLPKGMKMFKTGLLPKGRKRR